MLPIEFIRENPALVKGAVRDKNFSVDIDALLALDGERRKLLTSVDSLRAERNRIAKEIPTLPADQRPATIAASKELNARLVDSEKQLADVEGKYRGMLLQVPNVPLPEIPVGSTDADNVEVRRWGEARRFDFTPKDHIELARSLGIVDFENSHGFAGARSYSLLGNGVMLQQAILQFALQYVEAKLYGDRKSVV